MFRMNSNVSNNLRLCTQGMTLQSKPIRDKLNNLSFSCKDRVFRSTYILVTVGPYTWSISDITAYYITINETWAQAGEIYVDGDYLIGNGKS